MQTTETYRFGITRCLKSTNIKRTITKGITHVLKLLGQYDYIVNVAAIVDRRYHNKLNSTDVLKQ